MDKKYIDSILKVEEDIENSIKAMQNMIDLASDGDISSRMLVSGLTETLDVFINQHIISLLEVLGEQFDFNWRQHVSVMCRTDDVCVDVPRDLERFYE